LADKEKVVTPALASGPADHVIRSPRETIRATEETIFQRPRRRPETDDEYHSNNKTAFQGEIVMRAIAFILAFAFALGGGSVVPTTTTTTTAPNAGLFLFDAPAAPTSAPVVLASR
jgi:hypothetical protein